MRPAADPAAELVELRQAARSAFPTSITVAFGMSPGPDVVADARRARPVRRDWGGGIERSHAARRGPRSWSGRPRPRATIHRNLDITGLAAVAVVHTLDVARFLAGAGRPGAPFDLVFCDPPYDMAGSEVQPLLEALTADGLLTRAEPSS